MAKVSLLLLFTAAVIVIASQVEARQMAKSPPESKIVSKSIVRRSGEVKVSEAPEGSEGGESLVGAEAPAKEWPEKHGGGRSVAGGGVIIGGLLTAILAAVFCYIRVTRRRNNGSQNQ